MTSLIWVSIVVASSLASLVAFTGALQLIEGKLKARGDDLQGTHVFDASAFAQRLALDYPADTLGAIIRAVGVAQDSRRNFSSAQSHKVAHVDVKTAYPKLAALIEAEDLASTCSHLLGKPLELAPRDEERYAWFLRLYDTQDDFLGWHYDNNFSSGERWTLVVNLFCNDENGSHLITNSPGGGVRLWHCRTGVAVLMNGARVEHAITRQQAQGVRISLVVPLYERYEHSAWASLRRRIRGYVYGALRL